MVALLYPKELRVITKRKDFRVEVAEFCEYVRVGRDGRVGVASNTRWYCLGEEMGVAGVFPEQRVLMIK